MKWELVDGKNNKIFERALLFLRESKLIGLDTETNGLDPYRKDLLLISAGNQHQQFVFDVARLGKKIDQVVKILGDSKKLTILHNAKFDYKFFRQKLGLTLENIFDTMLAEQLLLVGIKKDGYGLDDVAEKYMGVTLNKAIRDTFVDMKYGDEFTELQLKYSCEDVQYLVPIFEQQRVLLEKYSLQQVAELEMNAIAPTGDMELNGMFLDMDLWLDAEEQAIKEKEEALKELDALFEPHVPVDMFGKPLINYNSPLQILEPLKLLMGSEGKNLANTKEDTLKNFQHIPVVAKLLEYREKEKRITTYGASFLDHVNPITRRIHTDFSQLRTDTGRYASSDPNLQNIPKLQIYRKPFVSGDPDYRIITCDYSQMELRILADLSLEPSWREIFRKGTDLHCEIGSLVYGKTIRKPGTLGPNDPGENIELRGPVKSLNFGVSYGMGAKKLANQTGMPYVEAKRIIEAYWKAFPKVKGFFDEFVKKSIDQKCIVSPYDKRLRWLEGFDWNSKREVAGIRNKCMNFPMQSGNASIIKLALTKLRQLIRGKDMHILSTVHDEIIVRAHKDASEEALFLTKSTMIAEAESYIKNVPIEVEGKIDICWTK